MKRGEVAVSIILPTYNRSALLPRSIKSVLGQTYGDFELIVVDDGSQDDTAAVVAGFADERVRYMKLPRNRGLPAARNAGLAEARGAYLAFQDSDDEWQAEKLERQKRELDAHPDAAVVYSDMYRVRADGRVLYHRSPTIVRGRLINPQTRYWQSYMLAMQPVLMRRVCLDELLFDERLVRFEDLDLHLRVAQHYEFVHLKEPLVSYHETHGLTTDRHAELQGRRQLVRKYATALLSSDPLFAIKETMDVLLKRSLLPLVNQHLTPL
jgi:glycosyltransferase involved in cell wall biosynthesis